ncbi:sugar transferase [Candidatus Dojkabacteria bacterium]|nr:sugar transferase [Candidatus Dojkabacteria bacterium]
MYELVKRISDCILAVILLCVLLPLLFIISVLILFDGTGGPIFSDDPERVGKGGKRFRMYKFRSMIPQAHNLLKSNPSYRKIAKKLSSRNCKLPSKEDPRVTSVGRFLRRWDLDEIPQLVNVIIGQMSIIGPRPYYVEELMKLKDENLEFLVNTVTSVRPGITGLWQVSGRNELTIKQRLKMDAEYARERTVLMDIIILIKTPIVVLFRIGAW